MPPTEQNLFFYNGDGETIENLTKYSAGGLHPVILGDVLPKPGTCISDEAKQPRYRIAQKLAVPAIPSSAAGWSSTRGMAHVLGFKDIL